MARQKPERLLKRADKAFQNRDANRNLYEDCYELYSPYRNTLTAKGKAFNSPTRQYDSTGQISAQNFVNTLVREFTPPFTKWAELKSGKGVIKEQQDEHNKQLEIITDIFFSYLDSSNFYSAVAEMYFEWGIGTGALWFYEGDEEHPFNFVSSPISEMGIDEGKNGKIDFRCRQSEVKASLLKELWPKAKIPESLDVENSPDKEHTVLECFYYDYEEMIHRYDVIVQKECIWYTEHTEEICFTPRWMKIPGNPNGFGPFLFGLADVKCLNTLKEFLLRSAALDVAGVYTITSDGALNPNMLNIAPNTFIPVERNAGENGPTISRLDTSSNFQLQEYIATGLQDQIRKTLLDNRLPAETPQPKTAFEIAQRMREFQTSIGAAFGRGYSELIIPLFQRGIGILMRKGLIPKLEGFKIDNFFTELQVISPIAQTQKVEDVQRFIQAYQMMQMISPELAMTSYKVEEIPQWLTEQLGTPASLTRTPAERTAMQTAGAQLLMQGAQQ